VFEAMAFWPRDQMTHDDTPQIRAVQKRSIERSAISERVNVFWLPRNGDNTTSPWPVADKGSEDAELALGY
jgi:hypothetical protein